MKEYYTVGEISKLFQISTDTLRYYDRINLLKPWMTGENNYRYYSKAQFEMISTILLLRNIGTPIAKLQQILRHPDTSLIEAELNAYRNTIDRQIQELIYTKEQACLLCHNMKETCYDETITLKKVPTMYSLLKEYDCEHDELDINEIRAVNHSSNRDWISYANLISTIDKDLLLQREFHTYKTYGYLSEYPLDIDQTKLLKIFESRWCVCCNAKVERIDHLDIDPIYHRMMDYIEEHHYQITDDAIERNVLDLYGDKPNDLTIYFRLYIPVQI